MTTGGGSGSMTGAMLNETISLEPRTFGEAVFLLTKRSGLSVREVAEAAGVTSQALYEWLWKGNGTRPSWASVVGIARALAPALDTDAGTILAELERLDRRITDKGLSRQRPNRTSALGLV